MPAPTHLLERAYQLINANQLQNAELVLDAVVRVEPQSVEAWKTYLMIHQSQNDLDWLKERILKTKELSEADKTKLINYYLLLSKQLNGAEEVVARRDAFALLLQEEKEETTNTEKTSLKFELIDTFDYPTKVVKKETRIRPRRRAVYNPFTFDFVNGIFKAMARNPFGKKVATHIQETIGLVNALIKNPKDAYVRFSKAPHFEKYAEVALLTSFILGVRLVISSHFLGYIFLGMFVMGGRWWLMNFGNHNTSTTNNQVRVYLHENEINLPAIKEMEMDQEQKLEKENFEKKIK
jgi:hypothetical protein